MQIQDLHDLSPNGKLPSLGNSDVHSLTFPVIGYHGYFFFLMGHYGRRNLIDLGEVLETGVLCKDGLATDWHWVSTDVSDQLACLGFYATHEELVRLAL